MYEIEVKLCNKQAWFTPAESNAYYATKYSREGITAHGWGDGSGPDNHDNIVNYFLKQADARVKSVNYVVSDKKITMMVDPDNVAWCSNGGNPTTISIEHQPNLGDEGYKRSGWLIASLEKKYGHKLNIYPHSKWTPTACPVELKLDRLRAEADTASAGGTLPGPAPVPETPKPTTPSAGSLTVHLPASVQTWAAYKSGSQHRKGTSDQVGTLLPSKHGGLTYAVIANFGSYVTIKTQSFGVVDIWVQGTEAILRTAPQYVQDLPATSAGSTVTFPASVDTWAVYKVGSSYVKGSADQVGTLRPRLFGGLTYPIIENRGNVVVIKTQDFGQVAAWVQNTEALIQ
jgi:hypothetical protein